MKGSRTLTDLRRLLPQHRVRAGRAAFEADRARDIELRGLGYDVIRLTWRQLVSESRATAATVRRVLSRK
jgi:very-short-patch-repair endonuclease